MSGLTTVPYLFPSALRPRSHIESRFPSRLEPGHGGRAEQSLRAPCSGLHKVEENSSKPAYGVAYCGSQEFIMDIKLNESTGKAAVISEQILNLEFLTSD